MHLFPPVERIIFSHRTKKKISKTKQKPRTIRPREHLHSMHTPIKTSHISEIYYFVTARTIWAGCPRMTRAKLPILPAAHAGLSCAKVVWRAVDEGCRRWAPEKYDTVQVSCLRQWRSHWRDLPSNYLLDIWDGSVIEYVCVLLDVRLEFSGMMEEVVVDCLMNERWKVGASTRKSLC